MLLIWLMPYLVKAHYFSVSTNLTNLRYSFDARKLVKTLPGGGGGTMQTNPFNTIGEAEEWIKKRFQLIFQQNAGQIFQTLGVTKFQELFGVNNLPSFLSDIVPDLENSIYLFIKVE